jgi:hypothetical protein
VANETIRAERRAPNRAENKRNLRYKKEHAEKCV